MDPILQFDQVTLPATDRSEQAVSGVHFALCPGDLLLVEISDLSSCPPLADVAQGLMTPEAGTVRIGGREWSSYSPDEEAHWRHRIGRVFGEQAWLSNLDVDENITLSQRHHTRRPIAEINDEALSWATRFNRSALPVGRPAWTSKHELMIAQWIRAFVGDPVLFILERPTRDTASAERAKFVDALSERRQAGAVVLWLTPDLRVVEDVGLVDIQQARLMENGWEMLK